MTQSARTPDEPARTVISLRTVIRSDLRLTRSALALGSGVLGLLLAFRTNQAYLRYQQLCTTWVSLATHSLNMARNAAQLDFKLYSAVLRHVIVCHTALQPQARLPAG